MKIVVVGVGALGSHMTTFCRNIKADWVLVDMDRVEAKNVASQAHTKMGVGRNKTSALQQSMSGLYGARVQAVPHRLDESNVAQLLGGADLVVDCVDNGATRRVIQAFVRAQTIPCLHGALDASGTIGRSQWDEDFTVHDEDGVGVPTCEDGEHLPFIAAVSSALALSVQRFCRDGTKVSYMVTRAGTTRSK